MNNEIQPRLALLADMAAEFETARTEWIQAQKRYVRLITEVGDGTISGADGTLRITATSREYRAALDRYRASLNRLSECYDSR